MGFSGRKRGQESGYAPGEKGWVDFSGGKEGQESGYAPGEKGRADFSVGKKGQGSGYAPEEHEGAAFSEEGLHSDEKRKVWIQDTLSGRREGL